MTNSDNIFKYIGAIHVHSVFSDGTGDIETISKAAKKNNLDWVIVADHNNFDIEEGIFNGVYIIKGVEYSPEYDNHYLALGLNECNSADFDLSLAQYIEKVRTQNGFGFAAHPDESNTRKNNYPPIKFDKTQTPDGVEIWNWFSTWADNLNDRNLFSLAYSYFFRHNLITEPKAETLLWWDELNKNSNKIIPAIGGVDCHALKVKKFLIPLTIFPYSELFSTITNQIYLKSELSKDFESAKNQILNAIKVGSNLIYNKRLTKNAPDIYITNKNQKFYPGANVNYDEETYININLKSMFAIRLIYNGEILLQKNSKNLRFKISEKGKYRVEISKGKLGCIYSNPFLVK